VTFFETQCTVADPEGAMSPLNLWQFFDVTYITLTSLVVLVHSFLY